MSPQPGFRLASAALEPCAASPCSGTKTSKRDRKALLEVRIGVQDPGASKRCDPPPPPVSNEPQDRDLCREHPASDRPPSHASPVRPGRLRPAPSRRRGRALFPAEATRLLRLE